MLYFHAILNHLKMGLQKYARRTQHRNVDTNDAYPLLIFDHFEALPLALKTCTDPKHRQTLLSVIYSILQYSTSICHDLSLSHVMFVGNDLQTTTVDTPQKTGSDCMQLMNEILLKHGEFWNMSGIDKDVA
eukprot:CAMPEP_0202725484 /NCGR_PEP_ID=MMETSP1385-20130828/182491_1 /ASSEMBLY_ACC=CAM_ASM_000861 /TAXON_ID=933848 /ORGANISM="Elphidium margaritaceum" /LENGTH=130 /DNA_ID=CAMNT_0049391585 /DNA_START=129 /DNA_END=517 /DNA_ORIENTATION=-